MKLLHIIELYKAQSTFKTCREYSIIEGRMLVDINGVIISMESRWYI